MRPSAVPVPGSELAARAREALERYKAMGLVMPGDVLIHELPACEDDS